MTSPQQLSLDLKNPTVAAAHDTKVVVFVDATTRSIREQAVERVKASGIFKLPKSS
jgi:hypothetical protein